jgi:hypothetical protein
MSFTHKEGIKYELYELKKEVSDLPTDIKLGIKVRLSKAYGSQSDEYVIQDIRGNDIIIRKEKGYDSGFRIDFKSFIDELKSKDIEIILNECPYICLKLLSLRRQI